MSRKLTMCAVVTFFIGLIVSPAVAQQHGSHHGDVTASSAKDMPLEAGQSAFAAIAEIVRILDADPETDWSKVDITAIRNHLVDMDELTLNSSVEQTTKGRTVTFFVSGNGRTVGAIRSMVPAHAKELDKIPAWSASTTVLPNGAKLIVSAVTDEALMKIEALGFFGMMAIGSHHQPHHLAMATGRINH
ncbi:MAG: hypothetical protein NXI27_23630 [Alphaproteobacteria bacterium]|nr:hypothetical protein [Alphaproteobacteria bacterium]